MHAFFWLHNKLVKVHRTVHGFYQRGFRLAVCDYLHTYIRLSRYVKAYRDKENRIAYVDNSKCM